MLKFWLKVFILFNFLQSLYQRPLFGRKLLGRPRGFVRSHTKQSACDKLSSHQTLRNPDSRVTYKIRDKTSNVAPSAFKRRNLNIDDGMGTRRTTDSREYSSMSSQTFQLGLPQNKYHLFSVLSYYIDMAELFVVS